MQVTCYTEEGVKAIRFKNSTPYEHKINLYKDNKKIRRRPHDHAFMFNYFFFLYVAGHAIFVLSIIKRMHKNLSREQATFFLCPAINRMNRTTIF